MQRIAIRTFNDVKNEVPHEKDSWRAAVPPQASVRDAEQHGKLDAGGQLDATTFNLLANQSRTVTRQIRRPPSARKRLR